ncbi:MAG: iron-containing alcohol dehydrogenase [Candidatus Lokiarchaeota archaeon]|nr:iron-containing alcohol dehydrogenase [Candidatus Lokiarchaeota archaeon]
MPSTIKFGQNLAVDVMNDAGSYVLVTQTPPFTSVLKSKLSNFPAYTLFPKKMDIHYQEELAQKKSSKQTIGYVIGFGGGVAIDTAKYLSWKWNLPLIQIPSIISTDAFLTHEIGVRVENKVRYIGKVVPEQLIIDYEIIKSAPKVLNYAGTCDVLSICTALGDWKIAHEQFGDPMDVSIFRSARDCAQRLLDDAFIIKEMQEEGIRKLVGYLQEEIQICEKWGSSRPEEGGEHHLAYCIEELSPKRYLHGALVALNILTVLRLQEDYAEFQPAELKHFFDIIGHSYTFSQIGVTSDIYRKALDSIMFYVRREKLEKGIWYTEDPFLRYSIAEIIDWISKF